LLEDTKVKVATVVGFPHGAMASDVKRYETEVAIDEGAQEIDMVINIGRLKDRDDKYVLRELRDVAEAADERCVKVILETCLLNEEEKVRACHLILDSGAQFVKTSTGFASAGATLDDVRLLRESVGARFGVKASGGIRSARVAIAMIEAGANRLGTSASVGIIQELVGSQA
jgi:deoxyribose-phosphate aldolase